MLTFSVFSANTPKNTGSSRILCGVLSALLVAAWMPVQAKGITVSDEQTATQILRNDRQDKLTVTEDGSIIVRDADPATAISVEIPNKSVDIINYGTIFAAASFNEGFSFTYWSRFGHAYAISIGRNATNATIANHGTISIYKSKGDAILINENAVNTTINNTGTISAQEGDRVHVINIGSGAENTTITNTGTIFMQSGSSAISIGKSENTTIKNTGTIFTEDSYSHAIAIGGRSENITITNTSTGNISTEDSYSSAVSIGGRSENITITNSGTISTEDHHADAIYIRPDATDIAIANHGTISTSEGYYGCSFLGCDYRPLGYSTAIGIDNNATNTTIINTGTIFTEGGYSDAIEIGKNATSATIDNTGVISTEGELSDAISFLSGAENITINNSGTISTEGKISDAIEIGENATNVTINNSGSISAVGTHFSSAIYGAGLTINLTGGRVSAPGTAIDASRSKVRETVNLYRDARVIGNILLGSGSDIIYMDGTAFDNPADFHITGDIDTGGGHDSITMNRSSSISGDIDMGAQADSIHAYDNARIDGSIDFGAGTDTIVVSGEDFADDSVAHIDGSVIMGEGNDFIAIGRVTVINASIDQGAGDDFFLMSGTAPVVVGNVRLGKGDDLFHMGASSTRAEDNYSDTPQVVGNVHAGGGADIVELFSSSVVHGNVYLGGAGNTFGLHDNARVVGDVVYGNGRVTPTPSASGAWVAPAPAAATNAPARNKVRVSANAQIAGTVDMGTHAALVEVSGSGQVGSIVSGDHDDEVSVTDNARVNGAIALGGGDDRLDVRGGSVVGGGIDTGGGDDTVNIEENTRVAGAIDLGAGTDTLNYAAQVTAPTALDIRGVENFSMTAPMDDSLQMVAAAGGSGKVVYSDLSLTAVDGRALSDVTAVIHGTVSRHLADSEPAGAARRAWLRGLNSSRTRGRDSRTAAYEHDHSGFVSGYDDTGRAVRFGFVLGVSNSDLKTEGLRASKRTETLFGGGYGQADIGAAWDISATLLLGRERHANTHFMDGNREVLGDFSSTFASLAIGAGGEYRLGKYALRPSALLIHNRSRTDGYTEALATGAGQDSLLTYDARTANSLVMRTQAALAIPLRRAGDLEVFAGAQNYRLGGGDITGALGDTRFAFDPQSSGGASGTFIGASLAVELRSGLRLNANLESGRFSGDESYFSGQFGINYTF